MIGMLGATEDSRVERLLSDLKSSLNLIGILVGIMGWIIVILLTSILRELSAQ